MLNYLVRIGLGIAVFLISLPLISMFFDYVETDTGCFLNICFSTMLAAGTTLLPRREKQKVVVIRPKGK
jgi:hypothetical protein